MSVRSINYNINASYGAYNQKLTPQTKHLLEQAGIPYNQNTTESEGRKLLASAKNNNEQNLFSNQNRNTSLIDRAIALAKRLGVNIGEGMDLKQILALIESALEQKIAVSQNDIDEIKKLKEFSSELASLQAQANGSTGYDNTNQALMMSLEMLSEYNKNFLNK